MFRTLMNKDIRYFYVESDNSKTIIAVYNDYDWYLRVVKSNTETVNSIEKLDFEYDIDDVLEILQNQFDFVEEIEYDDIKDFEL